MTTQKITLDGKPFLVNTEDACISSWLIRGETVDATERDLIRQTVKPGDHVVDIGANIGLYTVLLSELVGPLGRVYAFEPDGTNFAILQENLRLRQIHNVQAEPLALFSHSGELALYSGGANKGAHSVVYHAPDAIPMATVKAVTFDKYFYGIRHLISFIKIDAEGAEAEILAGATTVFDQGNAALGAMMLEFNDTMQDHAGVPMDATLLRLIDAGFSLYVVADGKLGIMGAEDIPRIFKSMHNAYFNIWCKR